MIVHVEVINRTLDLRGPLYPVGSRLGLDTDNPLHAAVLGNAEWVRKVGKRADPAADEAPTTVPAVGTAALEAPVNRMVQTPPANKAVEGKTGKPGKPGKP